MIVRLCTYCILMVLLCTPAYAVYQPESGGLSGSATIRYAQLTTEEDGKQVLDASHFVQKYSILWKRAGLLSGGRAGEYDYSLGYEWSWIDSEVNGADVQIENPLDKILFRGNVLLAPGGLPFRLHLFSEDLASSNFSTGLRGNLFSDSDIGERFGIITSFQNGSHISTGLTLTAGVNNGAYRGQYRDILNALPKIYIDFRQDEVRDTKSITPRHYVDRNLAFVSLNKNKNWFHYRFFTHEDNIDSTNNYQRQKYLLGTIDHTNTRQWVDLTNWIKVSGDLSYTETTPEPNSFELPQKRYDYNMFTVAKRSRWKSGVYANFNRVRDGMKLSKELSVPVHANGRLNRDTRWRVRFENRHQNETTFESGLQEEESGAFIASRLEMNSQSSYMFSPILDLEYKDAAESSGKAVRTGFEIYNNPRYIRDLDLFGSYSLALINGSSTNGSSASYWEQQFYGRAAKDLNRDFRVGADQRLIVGSGEYRNDATDYIVADLSSLSQSGAGESRYFRSTSGLFMDHRPASRIYNRLELRYDYIEAYSDSGGEFTGLHRLNYYGQKVKASLSSELIIGSSLHETFRPGLDTVSLGTTVRQEGSVSESFQSVARLDYNPNRRHSNRFEMVYEWKTFEAGGSDQRYEVLQRYEYSFWKDRGLLRRYAMVGEEFEYENYTPSFGESTSIAGFTLFSEIYPTRQTLLSAQFKYVIDSVEETDKMLVYLSAGMQFSKFEMSLDYAYGTRSAGINQPERVEHKWEVQVEKTF